MPRNELEIILSLRDEATRALKRAQGALKGLEGELKRAKAAANQMWSELDRMSGSLATIAGSGGAAYALAAFAKEAYKAEVGTRLFVRQLERMNQDAEAGLRELKRIADRLGVLPDQIADYATQLLRQGLSMREIAQAFEGAAASALAAGKDVLTGIDAVTNAIVNQQSVYLNYAGIAENLDAAYREYAKTLGKTVDALTKEERARAAVLLVQRATKEEVADLDTLLGGLTGKQNRLNKELAEFRRTLGRLVLPSLERLLDVATGVLDAINRAPPWLKQAGASFAVMGTAISGVAVSLGLLRSAILPFLGPVGWFMLAASGSAALAAALSTLSRETDPATRALQSVRGEVERLRGELADAKSADDLITKLRALGQTLTGPAKEAWTQYIEEAEKSKAKIEDIAEAAEEAIAKFLAVQRVAVESSLKEAQAAFERQISVGLGGKAFERFPKWIKDGLEQAAKEGGLSLLRMIDGATRYLRQHLEHASSSFEASQYEAQIAHLERLRPLAEKWATAQAKLNALQEQEKRILAALNGEQGWGKLNGAIAGDVTPATDQLRKALDQAKGSVENLLKVSAKVDPIENLGKGLEQAAQATRDAAGAAEEAATWYDVFNDRLDRTRLLIESYSNTVGQLGASEVSGEGQYPRSRFPIVAEPGLPTAGGAQLSQLYLTDGQRQRMEQLAQLQDTLREAGLRSIYVTREQADAYARLQALLRELGAAVAGYVAELDSSTYTTANARQRVQELYEQYKSLRLTMEAAGRRTLYITNKEHQEHGQLLRELVELTAGYAAEVEDTAYVQAEQREEMTAAAAAAELLREKLARLNSTLENLKTSAAAGVADALSNLIESGDWRGFVKKLGGMVLDGIGSIVDAVVPGLGRVITALGRLWITVAKKINDWFDSWSARGQERLRKAAQEQQRELAQGFTFVSASAFSAIAEHTQRFLFWTRKTFEVVVNEQARAIAQTLEQGVLGGLMDAMRAFLEGAQDWQEQLKEGLRSAIENAVIEAVIQGAIFKGVLGEALTKLTESLAKGNYEAARKYVRDIAAQAPELTREITRVLEPFRQAMAGLRSGKSGGDGGLTTPGTQTIRYELPTAPVLAAPAWVDRMGEHVAKFGEAVDRFAKARISVDVRLSGDLAYSVRGLA